MSILSTLSGLSFVECQKVQVFQSQAYSQLVFKVNIYHVYSIFFILLMCFLFVLVILLASWMGARPPRVLCTTSGHLECAALIRVEDHYPMVYGYPVLLGLIICALSGNFSFTALWFKNCRPFFMLNNRTWKQWTFWSLQNCSLSVITIEVDF